MNRAVTIRPLAQADLAEIGDYIALDDRRRAQTFVAEIEAVIFGSIAERPASFPARDDLTPGLRAARHGRYLIFFTERGGQIDIVRVLHGARDLARMFGA